MSNTDQPIFQDLKSTIKTGDYTRVQSLLAEWRSDSSIPGPTSSDIEYLIPRAAEGAGQPVILEYLLSQRASTDIDAYIIGKTQSIQVFEVFIKHGWRVSNGVLHSHIRSPELVAFFLNNGANANRQASRGYQPLETAALCAPLESVQILFSHGAQIGTGSRAMNAAARGDVPDRIPIMSLLLEHGADINALAEDYPAMSEAKKSGRKGTPLHSAAKWGNTEATAWLLEHGANAAVRNEMGETAEEWGKRFERNGPESVLRIRRDIFRKNKRIKENAEAANASRP